MLKKQHLYMYLLFTMARFSRQKITQIYHFLSLTNKKDKKQPKHINLCPLQIKSTKTKQKTKNITSCPLQIKRTKSNLNISLFVSETGHLLGTKGYMLGFFCRLKRVIVLIKHSKNCTAHGHRPCHKYIAMYTIS